MAHTMTERLPFSRLRELAAGDWEWSGQEVFSLAQEVLELRVEIDAAMEKAE